MEKPGKVVNVTQIQSKWGPGINTTSPIKEFTLQIEEKDKKHLPVLDFTGKTSHERLMMLRNLHHPPKPVDHKIGFLLYEFVNPICVQIKGVHYHPLEALEIMGSTYPLDFPEFLEHMDNYLTREGLNDVPIESITDYLSVEQQRKVYGKARFIPKEKPGIVRA
jgi:hypothetical protein